MFKERQHEDKRRKKDRKRDGYQHVQDEKRGEREGSNKVLGRILIDIEKALKSSIQLRDRNKGRSTNGKKTQT